MEQLPLAGRREGLLQGGHVHPGVKLLPRHPSTGGVLGVTAAKHNMGICARGRGMKGRARLLSRSRTGAGEHLQRWTMHPAGWRGISACRAGGEVGTHQALAPQRICGMPRTGSRALLRRCLCGSLLRGELFKQRFSFSQPPRSALPTRLASCWCRQSRHECSGGRSILPRCPWVQPASSQAACPWALRARLCQAPGLTHAHTLCCL